MQYNKPLLFVKVSFKCKIGHRSNLKLLHLVLLRAVAMLFGCVRLVASP
jgi:hypothetical protein